MKTNLNRREAQLIEALDNIKSRVKNVLDDVAGDLYCDYLPHIEYDTDMNIGYIVDDIIKNILKGNIKKEGEHLAVLDRSGYKYRVGIGKYSEIVKPIVEAFSDELKCSRIKQLEAEVACLKDQLHSRLFE